MTTTLPHHREMALSRYAYDLGVPLPDFLLRLHLCETIAEAMTQIAAGHFQLNGVIFSSMA